MGGMNETATIYLLEDINDLRYVGSTSEKDYRNRLSTHKRDKKEDLLKIRKRNCSSMKLDLEHTIIIPLMVVKNDKETRSKWEAHYINNVYPECVNSCRYLGDKGRKKKHYENAYASSDLCLGLSSVPNVVIASLMLVHFFSDSRTCPCKPICEYPTSRSGHRNSLCLCPIEIPSKHNL